MGHEVRESKNGSNDGPAATRDIAKAKSASGETQILVCLCQVDSPDAEARMKRALQLILRAGQRDNISD